MEQLAANTVNFVYKYMKNYLLMYDNNPWGEARAFHMKPNELFHPTTRLDERIGLRAACVFEADVFNM